MKSRTFKHLTKKDKKMLREYVTAGKTDTEIAELTGWSKKRVYNAKYNHIKRIRKPKVRITTEALLREQKNRLLKKRAIIVLGVVIVVVAPFIAGIVRSL